MTEIFSNSKIMIGQAGLVELLVVLAFGGNTVLLIVQAKRPARIVSGSNIIAAASPASE
jgi:hypothetical protein